MMQFAIAIDQLINTLAGGMADETISARAFRLQKQSRAWQRVRKFIDAIFFWDAAHCEQSWRAELLRDQLPKGYRL